MGGTVIVSSASYRTVVAFAVDSTTGRAPGAAAVTIPVHRNRTPGVDRDRSRGPEYDNAPAGSVPTACAERSPVGDVDRGPLRHALDDNSLVRPGRAAVGFLNGCFKV